MLRYDINKPRPRHGHKCTKQKIITVLWLYVLRNI